MKMKQLCFGVVLSLFSMLSSKSAYAERLDSIPEIAYEYGYPASFGVGVHGGTAGFGVQVYKSLGKQFGARLGFSHMPFSTNVIGTYSNKDLSTDINAKSTNISLLFGWTPFVNHGGFFRSFSIQLGGAYFTQLNGTLKSELKDPYVFGDLIVDPSVVGSVTTNVAWKETVNPYAGIGWSNIVIDNKFSMNFDLGFYYLSKPTVSMNADGLLEQNVNNASVIERNIKDYRYLPRVEIGLSYRLGAK